MEKKRKVSRSFKNVVTIYDEVSGGNVSLEFKMPTMSEKTSLFFGRLKKLMIKKKEG